MLTELLREFALQERLHKDLEALKVNLLKTTSEIGHVVCLKMFKEIQIFF